MIVGLGVIGSHVSCPLFPPSCGVINGVETPFFFGNLRQTCRRPTHCCTTNTRMSKYEVLGVSRFASFQEIKSAYQAAALATHPDKQARIAAGALKKEASKRFLLVQEAWETLRDNDFREEYDCRLDLQAGNVVISDEVRLDEMIFDDTDGGSFSHECRCGEVYAVTSAELREGFEVLDCRGCSLYIRVLGTPEETSTPLAAAGR